MANLKNSRLGVQGESQYARWNFKGLQQLKDNLKQGYSVDVGILKGKTSRSNKGKSNINNATLGACMEFGMVYNQTPPRSWLRMPVMNVIKGFNKLIESNKDVYEKALLKKGGTRSLFIGLGHAALTAIKGAFNSSGYGTWKPNAPSTMRFKKRNTPLKDTLQLKNAVSFRIVKESK